MRQATLDKFQQIAEEAISKAEQVSCPLNHFAEGMSLIEALMVERRSLAQEECHADEGGE